MTRPPKSGHSAEPSARFDALAAFARGYLHQDLRVEYGSAAGAAAAFAADASPAERRRLADDLAGLLGQAAAWSSDELAGFFERRLGAAWRPASIDDVRALLAALETRHS